MPFTQMQTHKSAPTQRHATYGKAKDSSIRREKVPHYNLRQSYEIIHTSRLALPSHERRSESFSLVVTDPFW